MNVQNVQNVLKKGSIIGKDTCDDKRYKKDLTDLIRSSKVESEYCAVHEIVFRDVIDEKGKKRKDKKEFPLVFPEEIGMILVLNQIIRILN